MFKQHIRFPLLSEFINSDATPLFLPNRVHLPLRGVNGGASPTKSFIYILTIGLEPITLKEQILNLPCLPFHQVSF